MGIVKLLTYNVKSMLHNLKPDRKKLESLVWLDFNQAILYSNLNTKKPSVKWECPHGHIFHTDVNMLLFPQSLSLVFVLIENSSSYSQGH